MAPWNVTWPFGDSNPDLPDSIAPAKGGSDSAFEVFIDGALTKIYNEASGRSKENRAIREACKAVLDGLRGEGENGVKKISTPLDAKLTAEVFKPLELACASGNAKLSEPALGCLHKLVSHAYLHAESTPAGRLNDDSVVAQVVQMVTKCGEQSGAAIQLAVLRALLTIATAEHFVVHGDCLMQTVRTAFHVALGAESEEIKRTARNALLQMLNTIVKRVTQYSLSRVASAASGGSLVVDRATLLSMAATQLQETIPEDPGEGAEEDQAQASAPPGEAAEPPADPSGSPEEGPVTASSSPSSPRGTQESHGAAEGEGGETPGGGDAGEGEAPGPSAREEQAATEAADPGLVGSQGSAEAGVESPQQGSGSGQPEESSSEGLQTANPGSADEEQDLGGNQGAGSSVAPDAGGEGLGDTRTAQLATLAEQADLRGLEKALDQIEAERGQGSEAALDAERSVRGLPQSSSSSDKEQDVRRVVMREKRQTAWRHLTLNERDVLTVLSAICKMAARETGIGAVESLLHEGKLMALDLLYRILENPLHVWNNVRPEFCEQLRQYLWPALLRNSLSPYREAFQAVTHLLACILTQPKLRAGLKVEINAFYPLVLLRPLEAEKPDPLQQLAALECLNTICGNAQLMADLFVNYDCNLQASNLFERTLRGLARVIQAAPPPPAQPYAPGAIPTVDKIRDTAVAALLLLLKTLDERAQPLKELASANARADMDEMEEGVGLRTRQPPAELASKVSEVARFGAIKEKKHSLEAGISLFNRDAVKGMESLLASGTVEPAPEAIASFLRQHKESLDTTQVGEYFGHHEDLAVAVMHAYVDQESYAGLTIDAALRELLKGFRLPGEAQKIDRIMEKFAERYCRDNQGVFASADGPYLLAFALIMLNTDAHNPRAEKMLSCADFVTMCQAQDENGVFAPILPSADLEAMYGRILEREIPLPSGTTGGDVQGGVAARKKGIQASRLAAALGLSHMFRNDKWDKQHGVDVERARLMKHTREIVAKGQQQQAEHVWHTASHVQHVTAMLQVVGESLRRGLAAALGSAQDAGFAAPILEGFVTAIRLAGMLGLDALTDSLVASLAAATGVQDPSPEGSAGEAKEVAALATLVGLAAGDEAGFLGSGWVTVLRTLSALDLLKETLIHKGHRGSFFPTPPNQVEPSFQGNPQPSFLARPGQGPAKTRSISRGILWRLGLAANASGDDTKVDAAAASGDPASAAEADASAPVPVAGNDTFFHGHAAVLVNWSENEGREAVEQVYSRSARLNGDSVVVFVRALCAVSQEELVPGNPDEPARIYSLGRLMECAFHNLGRIRLIWGRLWAAVAPHLVSAACHSDPHIAALAVDHMRRLIANLLTRAELSHFTYQEDALRPLVSVLRHSGSSNVREQVVALIAHSITAHPRGLGSGWRSVLQALAVAAGDTRPSVVDAALDAVQAVTAALFRGVGVEADSFGPVCDVVETAMRNPLHEGLSVRATGVVPAIAQRLRASDEKDWQITSRRSMGERPDTGSPLASPANQAEEMWGRLVTALTMVARHDPRAPVADAAAAALLGLLEAHGEAWEAATWASAWQRGLAYLLDVPSTSQPSEPSPNAPAGWSTEGIERVQRHAASHLPAYFALLAQHFRSVSTIYHQALLLVAGYAVRPDPPMAALGVDLVRQAVVTAAPQLDEAAWKATLQALSLASSPDLSGPIFRSGGGAGPTDALRCVSNTALLMQRTLCSILERCRQDMPASAELGLLTILQDSVLRANAFNSSAKRRTAATHLLQNRAAVPATRQPNGAHAAQNGGLGGEIEEEPSSSDEEDGAGPIDGTLQREEVAAALIRQEAQGGALLTEALLNCMAHDRSEERSAAKEAEKRLLSLSRRLLASAALQSWPGEGAAEGGDRLLAAEAFSWDQALRAPLITSVLGGYKDVSGVAWRQELPHIWPHLAHLIFSPQPAVRTALASLLMAQLPPMLHGL